MAISTNGKRLFIARHGETIFNKAGRIQEGHVHTPLSRLGNHQAWNMGQGLKSYFKLHAIDAQNIQYIASHTGRALQTLSLICEAIGANWHDHKSDDRLREIDMGDWGGQYYSHLFDDISDIIDPENGLFKLTAPHGENYADVSDRLMAWVKRQDFTSDMLIISHGMTSRVLRGLLLGQSPIEGYNAPAAQSLSQGSIVMICDGVETLIRDGSGASETA